MDQAQPELPFTGHDRARPPVLRVRPALPVRVTYAFQ